MSLLFLFTKTPSHLTREASIYVIYKVVSWELICSNLPHFGIQ